MKTISKGDGFHDFSFYDFKTDLALFADAGIRQEETEGILLFTISLQKNHTPEIAGAVHIDNASFSRPGRRSKAFYLFFS